MIIVRYSELGLKGNNRSFFEKRLVKNIRFCLKNNGLPSTGVRRIRGRILVDSDEKALPYLKNVFGIASISHATAVPLNLEEMKKAALEYAKARIGSFNTFRVTCQRIDIRFPIDSMTLEKTIGEVVFETLHKKVSLKEPELNIQFDIADQAYLFDEKIEGPGGLPIGSEGRVMVLMDNQEGRDAKGTRNSLIAAYLLFKRGCSILPVGTKELDLSPLAAYASGGKLLFHKVESFDGLDKLAAEKKILAIIVPDIATDVKTYPFKTAILRPLVGYTENELAEMEKRLFG